MNTSQNNSVAPAPGNPGETLRKAREAHGWTLAEVATQLRLKAQTLSQVEAGEFDRLPGHTFARGYVRSYAKLLGMDPAQMVSAFDRYTGTDAKGSEVHSLSTIKQPMRLPQSILRFVSFALLLVLIGFGLLWWQESSQSGSVLNALSLEHIEVDGADGTTQIHPLDEPQEPAAEQDMQPVEPTQPLTAEQVAAAGELPAAAEAPAEEESAAQVPLAPVTVAASEKVTAIDRALGQKRVEEAPAVGAVAVVPTSGQAAGAVSAVAVEAPASASEPQVPASAPAMGEGTLSISFSADCWIQVTDASGKVLLSGLKRAGDAVDLRGKAPLGVRLGYARGAQLSYNGQPVDVAPFVRGQTARLKVGS